MKKNIQFKQLLQSDDLSFICEAHNGLSTKIAEEAGFKGIWGSGYFWFFCERKKNA